MVEVLSRALEPDEREAVRGDLAESGETGAQALGAVFGLVARRQCGLWKDWKPWLTLAGLIVPLGALLSIVSLITADQNATYIWLYANNWDWALLKDVGFWHEFAESCTFVFASCLTVVCWSWTAGFVIGSQSRRGIHAYGALFGVMLAAGVFVLAPRYFAYLMPDLPSRLVDEPNSPSVLGFYKMLFPLIAQAALVALPSFWGMRRGADLGRFRPLVRTVLWTAAAASLAALMLEAPGIVVLLKMFWLARIRQSWPAHLLQIVVYWPVAYMAARAWGEHIQRKLRPA